MAVSVLIPTPSRKFTAGEDTVMVQAETVSAMVDALDAAHPGLGGSLRKPDGTLNKYVNIYVNDEDIRFLNGAETALKDGDQVSIVPAIAGGLFAGGS